MAMAIEYISRVELHVINITTVAALIHCYGAATIIMLPVCRQHGGRLPLPRRRRHVFYDNELKKDRAIVMPLLLLVASVSYVAASGCRMPPFADVEGHCQYLSARY